MANSIFMKAEEVQEFLGVSRTESYRIIKRLNEELKANGYMVISGRVSRKYLEEKVYGYVGSSVPVSEAEQEV
ncbi:MAG: DNA-binding protein [Clostridia bacterium]|nr:DNA-binding protein [Clostridia bacterium]MBQ4454357.1 DNA-binding protein [Clostridia bacterium]